MMESRFYSIKSFPERFPLWQMGSLIGDLMQPALQYNVPFMLTMGIQLLDSNTMKQMVDRQSHARPAERRLQDGARDAGRRQEAQGLECDGRHHRCGRRAGQHVSPAGTLHDSRDGSLSAEETAKAIWRARGFELNADVHMHRQALLASLPMTLSRSFHGDLKKMRRVTRKTVSNAIHLAPLIGEWRGTSTPTLVFGGGAAS